VQAVILDGLLRILAYLTLEGSFSAREQTILKELLQQIGAEPDEALQRIQSYLRQGATLQPTLLIRNLANQLSLLERYLFYAYLIQLAHGDRDLTPTEETLLQEIADAFNIPPKEKLLIYEYATTQSPRQLQSPAILIVGSKEPQPPTHFISVPYLPGYVAFLYLESANLILMRLIGRDLEAHLNGQWLRGDVIRVFPEGALLRLNYGYTLTYKEVLDQFRPPPPQSRLLWEVQKLSYRFKNGKTAIHPLSFEVWQGRLVGIMGPSGAGKSTLLRLLSGQLQPTTGKVYLNGINIHKQPRAIRGLLGYVPQDDLLIEELTVWENVFYAARLSYPSDREAADATEKVLRNLGLWHIQDLTVGSPLNPTISGGQRKRLNIALELVRQPLVLFVDEPTSGLSSSDALQVVETLQSLAREGRIVFFTLHQPSSEIYKKLDHLLFLDEGGYPIFWGSPLAALQHFRHAAGFADSENVECPSCRRVEPETLFDIIQQRLLDEKGQPTEKRRTPPERWYHLFWQRFVPPKTQIELYRPQPRPPIPPLAQFIVFLRREGLRKIRQSLSTLALILAAPLLGLIVGFILRYHPPDSTYTLYNNDNLPSALFVNILAMLFLGLLTPAEEILKDRKIRLREQSLQLSWGSYMHAKLLWAVFFSAIQTTLYWGIVSWLLQIPNAWGATWVLLFTVALLSNLIALNLSDTFTQPVPIYILIPILLIPQLVLSGAVIPYDKFNPALRGKRPIPFLADLSISRWAYESALVLHYTQNPYTQALFPLRQEVSHLRYQILYLIPALESRNDPRLLQETGDTSYAALSTKLRTRLQNLQTQLLTLESQIPESLRQKYHNPALEDLVLATHSTSKLLWDDNRPIRLYEPIFISDPDPAYAPLGVLQKPLGPISLYTPHYNLLILLLMGVGLWFLLFFRVLNNLFLRSRV